MQRSLIKRISAFGAIALIALTGAGLVRALTVSDGMEAGWVLGQPDFTSGFDPGDPSGYFGAANPPTASSMFLPEGADYDASRIAVADSSNNRVLIYLNVAYGAGFDGRPADIILGQTSGSGSAPNAQNAAEGCTTAVNACGLNRPTQVTFAGSRLYVADSNNNRVLGWDLAGLTTGAAADVVLGQAGFTTAADNAQNAGAGCTTAVNACGLDFPFGLDYAASAGRLIVADNDNERVLFFDVGNGVTNGEAAVGVLGKPDFVTNGAQLTQSGLGLVCGVRHDAARSRLYVVDCQSDTHNRVLVWTGFDAASFANGAAASAVLGQPNFTTGTPDTACGGGSSGSTNACGLNGPIGVDVNAAGNRCYVVDSYNHRVLEFDDATVTNGEAAVHVIGQPNFTANALGTTRTSMSYPEDVTYASDGRLLVVDDANHRVLIFGDHLGDDPLTVNGGTGTTSGNTASITSSVGASYSVTFPSGTSPLAPNASVIVSVGSNPSHPSIGVSATLPAGQTKTIVMPWTNDDVCIDDRPGASVATQGSCAAPKVRVNKSGFNADGECSVWEGTDTICRSGGTLVISGLEHSALYAIVDEDQDGVADDDDVCPGTNLGGPVPTVALRPNHVGDGWTTADGCNASQILACKSGNTEGEQKYGVPPGIRNVFTNRIAGSWAEDVSPADGIPDCFQ